MHVQNFVLSQMAQKAEWSNDFYVVTSGRSPTPVLPADWPPLAERRRNNIQPLMAALADNLTVLFSAIADIGYKPS